MRLQESKVYCECGHELEVVVVTRRAYSVRMVNGQVEPGEPKAIQGIRMAYVFCPSCGKTYTTDEVEEKCPRRPTLAQIREWMYDTTCEATDGCIVEPDGYCPHGFPSWLIAMGLI